MQAQCRALDLKGEEDERRRGRKGECCYRDVRRHSTYPIIYCLSKDFLPNGSHGIARGWVPGCSRPPTGLPPDTRNTGEVRLVRGTSRTSVRGTVDLHVSIRMFASRNTKCKSPMFVPQENIHTTPNHTQSTPWVCVLILVQLVPRLVTSLSRYGLLKSKGLFMPQMSPAT